MSGGAAGASPSTDHGGFFLSLPKAVSAVEESRLALLDYLGRFELDDRVINRIEVVLEELVSNVVRHAAEARTVIIEASCRDRTVNLAIQDDGVAFNPLERPEPSPFTTLEDATLGGLGLPLIRRLTRSVRYDRVGTSNRISAVIAAD